MMARTASSGSGSPKPDGEFGSGFLAVEQYLLERC